MIAYLNGTLAEKGTTRVVIDVAGLGYEVLIPLSTYDRLPKITESIYLHTHFHVRDDAHILFGFATPEERALFGLLVAHVSGVGPKLALNILSAMPISTFCNAIAANDPKTLSRINGVGKRSAERLIVELKDKLEEFIPAITAAADDPDSHVTAAIDDAVAALTTLGFKRERARRAVQESVSEANGSRVDTEALVRRSLDRLNRSSKD